MDPHKNQDATWRAVPASERQACTHPSARAAPVLLRSHGCRSLHADHGQRAGDSEAVDHGRRKSEICAHEVHASPGTQSGAISQAQVTDMGA